MENSRRSKKRSKFFWPEIGLLILGVLGFKPDLLFDILGGSNQSTYTTTRPVNQQQPISQQPLTSNPLLTWGVQAIQAAASQTMGGQPASALPHAHPSQTHPLYYPSYPTPQASQLQPQLNYAEYGNSQYQYAPNATGYSYPNANLAGTSNGNYYAPNPPVNYSGQGFASRVPPVDYQSTPASYPTQSRTNIPFPSTSFATQSSNSSYRAPSYNQPAYNVAGATQTQGFSNLPNQALSQTQDQYYWGAVDPRDNNVRRAGTQGSWVPNVPASNLGTGRVGRY